VRRIPRASGKAVSTLAARGCGGRGPMQIQLREGVSLGCAEAVLSGATHDTARPENWLRGKSIAQAVVEEGAKKDLFGSETEK
jgi:hypothetical protein